ncbi:MAG: cobalamin biosynthesis protein [Lachnospiraceae bacterium]|nr:cobalamin biosynthesis protein [Lachnospiraceae bacterium]
MVFSVISFTKTGYELSKTIKNKITNPNNSDKVLCFVKCEALKEEELYVSEDIGTWAKERFDNKDAVIFIGSTGITVRAISDSVKNKMTDSPVIVIDEAGKFVIPLLSGHMGGANDISLKLAKAIEACPVITTATDLEDKWAVDVFARENKLDVLNKDKIKKVSAKSLEGKNVRLVLPDFAFGSDDVIVTDKSYNSIDEVLDIYKFDKDNLPLVLSPKEYVLGIGCKKGKLKTEIESAVSDILEKAGIGINQIAYIASIDLKKDEEGILDFADQNRIEFLTYTSDELLLTEGDFSESEFVKEKTGVGNVCERAAVKACRYGGELVCKKSVYDGITLALARRKWKLENF